MEVKLSQAVSMLFGNSSFEMVFFEAIANSLDANATKIGINVSMKAFDKPDTLTVEISDNGLGFTKDRYDRFSKLFDRENGSHKGLGRLVYLCYFRNIKVVSLYEKTRKIEFEFDEYFDKKNATISNVSESNSGTTISMKDYYKTKVWSREYVDPQGIKDRVMKEFYPRLFQAKREGKDVIITISSTVGDDGSKTVLNPDDIPELKKVEMGNLANDLFSTFDLYYSIEEAAGASPSLFAAINVDGRTKKIDLVAQENLIDDYKMVFLLYSEWFDGRVDPSRQNITVSDSEKQTMQHMQSRFRQEVFAIIEQNIPNVKARNDEKKQDIVNRYPHLSKYLEADEIGYISRTDVLKKAQESFFKDQRDLLDAEFITDERYEKSLELSSMALTEYILFRQKTIEHLKSTDDEDSEAEIHNLFVPKGQVCVRGNEVDDLYRNCAWLLDDKYMTYETVLSDKKLEETIKIITKDEGIKDEDGRPDLALIFSHNPDTSNSFDVVIVEFKKRGLKMEKTMEVVSQLENRARKLMQHCGNKIQRIWFYGVIEFNDEIELALTGEYKELYSTGKMYYRETMVAIQKNPDIRLPIGVFILDLDSLIKDADCRNSVFLNLIKSKFLKQPNE